MLRNRAVLSGLRSGRSGSVASASLWARQLSSSAVRRNEEDILKVSLNDSDLNSVDTKNFFKYTWGRWLVDDEKQRAARETKFSLRGLADVLREKVDYLQKSPSNAELQIKTIAPYHEGKHNKIYRVDLVDGRSYALRIPYSIGFPEYRKARMQSEVATMDFLKKKHNVLMPSVVSWSPTKDNRLQSEYQIMDFVSGDSLMKQWHPGSSDIKAKSSIIKPVVDLFGQIAETKFNKYGSLYFTEDVASEYQSDLPYEGETDPDLVDRYRIGPTVEGRFWKGKTAASAAEFRGPWTSINDYLGDLGNAQIAYVQELLADPSTAENVEFKTDLEKALATFERFARTSQVLFDAEAEELSPEITAPRLHDPDLNPINIIHRTDPVKSYLLDLEGTSIRPFLLHGAPTFVKHKGPKIFKKEDIPDYETLSDADKRAVDHFIVMTQNQFAFEFLLKQTKPELFPAFSPTIKRRQELVQTAHNTLVPSKDYIDLDYDILRLAQEWQFLTLDRPFPVEYTQAQLDAYVQDMDAWSKHVLNNPFLETRGWVPINLFEQLLGEGTLVRKDNGNYEFARPFSV
ncbi:Aim9p [Sugiyamaella lignohabitans]|uniref:Altered inheritance of mitochondria protein 9, mitochondrial n=1 Tax=Sugiyamaella lignohabitans TaxID=796027 RepID=A0A167CW59_9ASCO|nr:Aim9p [Sugiyamaella lignohabitans]ANB12174.1 Aim9p [Sugiyamaella lignohabitans]